MYPNHSFLFNKNMEKSESVNLEIYTDGAYSSLRDQGGIGIVVVKDNKIIQTYNKDFHHTTNNQMELIAVIFALHSIKKPISKVIIHSDSMYVIGCAVKGWKRKKNVHLWNKFDEVFNKAKSYCQDISFCHVKGHDTNPYNNEADKLAVEASHYE